MECVKTSPSRHLGHLAPKTLDKTDLSFIDFAVFKPENDDDENDDVGSEEQEHDPIIEALCKGCLPITYIVLHLRTTHGTLCPIKKWN